MLGKAGGGNMFTDGREIEDPEVLGRFLVAPEACGGWANCAWHRPQWSRRQQFTASNKLRFRIRRATLVRIGAIGRTDTGGFLCCSISAPLPCR